MNASYALGIRSLSKTYRVGLSGCTASARALCGVHLEIGRGEVVVVVGAANSGKTTLLRCAAGLLAPDEGAVDRTPGADGQILLPTYLTDPIELARLQSTGERWELALVDNVDRVRGDVDAAFAVLAAARQVHASGAALLLAARDAASVSNVADRIVYIDRGRLRPPASVCQTPGAARVAETNVRSR